MHRNMNRIRHSKSDVTYLTIVYTLLGLFVAIVLYPIIYVVSSSFSSASAIIQGKVFLWPVDPGLEGYRVVLQEARVWTGFKNSVLYTVVYTLLSTAITFLGAYVLSRKEFPANKFVTVLFMITMFFGGGTIPSYLLVSNLGLLNTMWALILPGMFSVWYAIVGRTFIKSTIPEEMYESMCIDGGNYFCHLVRFVLPLSAPILAVIALNFALGMWNSYYSAMLYLQEASKYPLQLVLRSILISSRLDISDFATDAVDAMERMYLGELMKYSLIVIASVPLLIVYPFIQKYFVKGMLIGSLKG
ncbi:MAG: carbohydrate ABC transporter permease [Christensenellales bacterium]|jgi:putative aldouronate transport system permease protein